MHAFFFVTNFALAVFLMAASVASIGATASPGSFLGGILMFPLAGALAVAEWRAWYRKRRDVERTLGKACLVIAGLAIFGLVANVGEALQKGWVDGLGWFVLVGSCVAGHFVGCGLWRIRAARERQ